MGPDRRGTLAAALDLGAARVVAFTGGGGKTSAMFRLARELAAERVLITTTTRIWVPDPGQAALVLAEDEDAAVDRLGANWTSGVRALGTAVTAEGKLQGVPREWVGELVRHADRVLVEADGAAGKPLTAPRAYEPVIPPCAQLVVPVVGVDAVGVPLDAAHVHRAPEVAALTGLQQGAPLTPDAIATVVLHPEGNVKGAPAGARTVPLVNKVDTPAAVPAARELATALLARGAPRVLLAHLAGERPVVAVLQAQLQSVRLIESAGWR